VQRFWACSDFGRVAFAQQRQTLRARETLSTPKSANEHFLKESSPNARWVFRIRFQNPVVFTFSESGCFFRFFSFFVLDLVVTGNRVS
jgi:hypothetical protein